MKILLSLILSLVLLSCSGTLPIGSQLVDRSGDHTPEWVTRKKEFDGTYLYFTGTRTSAPSFEDAERDASADAFRKIISYFGEQGVIGYKRMRTETTTEVEEFLNLRGAAIVRSAKVIESYYERWQHFDGQEVKFTYNVFVHVRYPQAEVAVEKKRQIEEAKANARLAAALFTEGDGNQKNGMPRAAIAVYRKSAAALLMLPGSYAIPLPGFSMAGQLSAELEKRIEQLSALAESVFVVVRLKSKSPSTGQIKIAVSSALASSKLKETSGTSAGFAPDIEMEQIIGSLRTEAGAAYLLLVDSESEFSSKIADNYICYRARTAVKLIRLEDGEVLAALDIPDQKGYGNDDRRAELASFTLLATALEQKLPGMIKEALNGP
jgi:hypothetical protein